MRIIYAMLFIFCVWGIWRAFTNIDYYGKEEKEIYKEAIREMRKVCRTKKYNDKIGRYNRKLERYRRKLENSLYQRTEPVDDFTISLRNAYKQTKKFASYSCINNELLQYRLNKVFSTVFKLTTLIDVKRYINPEIVEFYEVELEQLFELLGEEPIFPLDYHLELDITYCLKQITKKADMFVRCLENRRIDLEGVC